MEGFKKFTAMFVLIQMVMVLFPAPVAYADQPELWSIDQVNIHNLAKSTDKLMTDNHIIDLSDYQYGQIDFRISITDPGKSGNCALFSEGVHETTDDLAPFSMFGKMVFNPAFFSIGNHSLDIELFTGNKCNGNSVKKVFNYSVIGEWASPLTAPNLISPANNSVVNGANVTNKWSTVDGATGYVYESYHDEGLTNLRYTNQYTNTEKTAYNVENSVFWWRVKAVNNSTESPWSDVWKLTVDNDIPTAPVITHPANEQYFKSQPILNSWTPSYDEDGIKEYRVKYVYDDGHTFTGGPYRATTNTFRNHTPGLDEQGGVTIWVQGIDNNGNQGEWSDPVHYYYDWEKPESTIDALDSQTSNKVLEININATDNLAVDFVQLWFRKDGGTCTLFDMTAPDEQSGLDVAYLLSSELDPNETVIFDTSMMGDGFYEFYSIAVDKAGNIEDKSPCGDTLADASTTVMTDGDDDNGNGDDDGNGDGDDEGDGTGEDETGGETTSPPVVLTPATPVIAAVAGDFTEVAEEQDISSQTTDDEEGEILGEEDEEEDEERCDWWWILSIILAIVLGGNYLLAKKYHENENLRKALMVTPVGFGLLTIYAHQVLGDGLKHVPWCYYLWLIVAALVAAYYLIKNYLGKKETSK